MAEKDNLSNKVPNNDNFFLDINPDIVKSYDPSQLLEVSRGDMSFVRSIVKMFISKTPIYIEKITYEFESGNFHEMGEIAHQLKQSIFAMGINSLRVPIMSIILVGRNNTPDDDLPKNIASLKYFAEIVMMDLKNDFQL